MKTPILKVGAIIVSLLLFYLIAVTLHEMSHYLVLTGLGGAGYITFPDAFTGLTYITRPPTHGLWAVYFAGGLGAFALMITLWAISRLTPTRWDMDDEFALAVAMAFNLTYGLAEGASYWWPGLLPWAWIPGVVAFALIAGIYMPWLLIWMGKGEENGQT